MSDWKDLVRKVAPTIGAALGGPFGGIATKFIADKFLGKPEATEEEMAEAVLSATPDKLLELRRLEHDFKTQMRELGIREQDLHRQDRASARELAARTTLLPQAVLATIFIIAFAAVLYSVFTGAVSLDGSLQNIAIYLLGILSAGVNQIMNFFFGSSSGSKEKTTILGAKG